ncbi:DUF3237 family protein [Streptomyces sp. NPDC088747]|uniref:DUF3237 family protein n=1 Tax=Streptomyces sp. NPDC088747 TaxID=3365886 RepID=UPI00381C8151
MCSAPRTARSSTSRIAASTGPTPAGPDQYDDGLQTSHAGHYYRTSPVFRTDAPAHRWLAGTVFVGLARPEHDVVVIRMYSVD